MKLILTLILSLCLIAAARAEGGLVNPVELAEAHRWSAARLQGVQFQEGERAPGSTEPPFSFVYGGQASAALLKEWKCERASRQLDEHRTERTSTWTDPGTFLYTNNPA